MPHFDHGAVSIYFEQSGEGYPLLLLAPGAMNSVVEFWANATINPLAHYRDGFRMVAMDQRNAGRSSGPLDLSDPWGSYAEDQLALLEHLGIDRFHVMGCCIGASFALKLIAVAPSRVTAAVLEQPIGIADGNSLLYEQMWRGWGDELAVRRPEVTRRRIARFGTRMWEPNDFVVSVSREFVQDCTTPLLVLPGTDRYHPTATGREIATLSPAARLVEPWNDSEEHVEETIEVVREFLERHVPGEAAPSAQ